MAKTKKEPPIPMIIFLIVAFLVGFMIYNKYIDTSKIIELYQDNIAVLNLPHINTPSPLKTH